MNEKLLKDISEKAIKYENLDFSSEEIKNNWLGNVPATEIQITQTESRLGIKLPSDYIDFLNITNGFSAPNNIEPSFESIDNVDFLKNIDPFTIEAYGLPELENSILIAGIEEEQYFLLIPPKTEDEEWKYWKFANWYPGEHPYKNLKDYFEDVLRFITKEHET